MTKRRSSGHRRPAKTGASSSFLLAFLVLASTSSSSPSSNIIFVYASGDEFPASSSFAATAPSPLFTTSRSGSSSELSQSSLFSKAKSSSLPSRVKVASFLRRIHFPSSHHRRPASSSSSLLLIKSISLHCFRLILAGYIANATYTILKEIWDEVQSELLAARQQRGGSGGSRGYEEDVREEQDMPYCSSSSSSSSSYSDEFLFGSHDDDGEGDAKGKDIDDEDNVIRDSQGLPSIKRTRRSRSSRRTSRVDDNCDDDGSVSSHHHQRQQLTSQMAATRALAKRLHSAGLPYAFEVKKMEKRNGDGRRRRRGRFTTSAMTVEDILQSLTRAEGNILSQTLLSPRDDGMFVGSSSNLDGEEEGEEEGEGDLVSSAAAAWNAIGGLTDAKESLLDLAFPLLPTATTTTTTSAQSSNNSNDYYGGLLSNPPGVLLYGPPGCGKGLLVRALASTIHARFLIVTPSVLLRKYVGETNLNVRALFSLARKLSPTVIFVDELDGLFRERGGEDHDVGRDLKTEFLQLWDGIRNHHHVDGGGGGGDASSSSLSSILVIGATNRPFDVDPAFLRRMPRKIYVGLPDYDSRISVLQGMLCRVPLDVNFDVALLATKTAGYSPSDIREVLQTAALFPLREARAEAIRNSSIPSSSSASTGNGETEHSAENMLGMVPVMPPLRRLRTEDVLRALEVSKPTHFSRKYQKELMNYVHNSGVSSPQREVDRDDRPPPSIVDASENNYNANNGNSFDESNQPQQDTDSSSDDEADSSESDYDEF